MVADIVPCSCMRWRFMATMRGLSQRSITTRIGMMVSDASVTCHDSSSITAMTPTSRQMSDHTVAIVPMVAWAPTTSEFMRLSSAPVWVRVKKASGSCWPRSNMAMRRSKIRLSPMWAPNQPRDRPHRRLAEREGRPRARTAG